MIQLNDVQKIYNSDGVQTKALAGITMNIEQGDYVAIMGTSGSGKTTLLNILGGMDSLTAGEYFFEGEAIHNKKREELDLFRRNKVSFVFQHFALMKYYTVYENVEMPLLAKGMGRAERKKKIRGVLEEVGIAELAHKKVTHISGGQQQRCAIARALASENPLILADEPTGALDKKTGEEIMKIFGRLHELGRTIVLITHDESVAAHAKRIMYLSDGILCPSDEM